MSKITKDNLSDNLREYLEGLGLTESQVTLIINNIVGSLGNLETGNKNTVVEAINELKVHFDTLQVQYEELKKVVNEGSSVVECISIELSASNLSFTEIGKSQELTATVLPSDCTESVTWISSNDSIATVTNGVVTSVAAGDCVITAVCGSKNAKCNISVALPDTEGYLLKEGQFITTAEFGTAVFNDDETRLTQLTDRKCIQMFTDSDSVTAFSYGKFIDADVITDDSYIKITLYREIDNVDNPNIFVALFNEPASGVFETFNSIGSSVSMYKQIYSGTAKTVYTFDISSFKNHTGYLGICYTNTVSDTAGYLYVSDIVYYIGEDSSNNSSGSEEEEEEELDVLYLFRAGADANTDVTGGLIYDTSVYTNSYKTYDMAGLKLGTTAKETPYLHNAYVLDFTKYDILNITIDEMYGIADEEVLVIVKPESLDKDITFSLSSGVNEIYMDDIIDANVTSGYIGIGFIPTMSSAYVHMTNWYLSYKNTAVPIEE